MFFLLLLIPTALSIDLNNCWKAIWLLLTLLRRISLLTVIDASFNWIQLSTIVFSLWIRLWLCMCVLFCFRSVYVWVFFSCGSYFWLHFLKREQKQTFPWYCLLTKTKLSFLYVFILIFRDLQITMVNFFFLLYAFLPQFLDACRTILRSFRLQWNEFWVRESSTSSASSSFSSDSMQNKSHKQLLPTVDPARGGAPSNLYFSHDFTVEYICKIVLLHNHYNHNSLCMYM